MKRKPGFFWRFRRYSEFACCQFQITALYSINRDDHGFFRSQHHSIQLALGFITVARIERHSPLAKFPHQDIAEDNKLM